MSQLFVACSASSRSSNLQRAAERVAPPCRAPRTPPPALAAALARLRWCRPAVGRADWWVEINKPPIELSLFHINLRPGNQ